MKSILIALCLAAGTGLFAVDKMVDGAVTIKADAGKITPPLEIQKGALIGKNGKGAAVYTFEVDADGDYVLWGRATGYGATNDSYFFFLDQNKPDVWDVNTFDDQIAKWQPIKGREFAKDGSVKLTKGTHTLTFTGREADTRLEKIFIARKGVKPQD